MEWLSQLTLFLHDRHEARTEAISHFTYLSPWKPFLRHISRWRSSTPSHSAHFVHLQAYGGPYEYGTSAGHQQRGFARDWTEFLQQTQSSVTRCDGQRLWKWRHSGSHTTQSWAVLVGTVGIARAASEIKIARCSSLFTSVSAHMRQVPTDRVMLFYVSSRDVTTAPCVSCSFVLFCVASCRVVSCRVVLCVVFWCVGLGCPVLCYAVLCSAVLCCAVLCCTVLYCAALCCAVLCCAIVLCCAVPCRAVPYCAVVLRCAIVLCCAVLCCAVLCCAVPCCAVVCAVLCCSIVLCCVVLLYCAVLCCAVLCRAVP